jgi:hypothetical protein
LKRKLDLKWKSEIIASNFKEKNTVCFVVAVSEESKKKSCVFHFQLVLELKSIFDFLFLADLRSIEEILNLISLIRGWKGKMPLFERRVEFEEQNKICCVRKSQEKKTIQIARKEVGETGKERREITFFLTFFSFSDCLFFSFFIFHENQNSQIKKMKIWKKKK